MALANGSVALGRNELLYTSFTGFVSLAGEATFGYDAGGTTMYAVGKLDLATTLIVKAQAKVNVGFSMAGAFRILVLPGTEAGWARVVVEKNRTSTFDVGVGVTVDARLATAGLPDTSDAPLALVESILGFRTPQVAAAGARRCDPPAGRVEAESRRRDQGVRRQVGGPIVRQARGRRTRARR